MIVIIVVLVGLFLVYELSQSGGNTAPDGTTSGDGFTDALANAIAKAENVDSSANNPGALSSGDVSASNITGQFNNAGVVIIDTVENGWNALYTKIQGILSGNSSVYSPDMTISDLAQTYTGGDNADSWAQSVSDSLGITPDTTLADAQSQYDGD